MSVSDMIKKSVLESYSQTISIGTIVTMIINMALAIGVGLFIYFIYKKYFHGVVYSRGYAMTLTGMTVLTCMVTLAISNNVVISLGMVGALSIVRYRTAVKEPLDLLYMFWAITSGITIGASMYLLAIIGGATMVAMVHVFSKKAGKNKAYIMISHFTGDTTSDEILRAVSSMSYEMKSKILRGEDQEMTLQLECKNDNFRFVEEIRSMANVKDVTLVQYNGEYHG